MQPNLGLLVLLFVALATFNCEAQSVYPADPTLADNGLGTISPWRGTYYDPTQSGTGIQVDVGANGNAFVALYAYGTDGAPTFYAFQGKYMPNDEVTRWHTGVIGNMSGGTFYSAKGGQCVGCPYVHPTN